MDVNNEHIIGEKEMNNKKLLNNPIDDGSDQLLPVDEDCTIKEKIIKLLIEQDRPLTPKEISKKMNLDSKVFNVR